MGITGGNQINKSPSFQYAEYFIADDGDPIKLDQLFCVRVSKMAVVARDCVILQQSGYSPLSTCIGYNESNTGIGKQLLCLSREIVYRFEYIRTSNHINKSLHCSSEKMHGNSTIPDGITPRFTCLGWWKKAKWKL